ncbi:MAG: DUF493 domain-containing protein [Pseudomonadota bacterium]
MTDLPDDTEIMQFPLEFPVKLIGRDDGQFHSIARALLEPIIGPIDAANIREARSSGGKYLALTVTFTATSRDQLDAVYRALSDSDDVLFAQ